MNRHYLFEASAFLGLWGLCELALRFWSPVAAVESPKAYQKRADVPLPPTDVLAQVISRTWLVNGPSGRGSAFPVFRHADGRVAFLTAAHVPFLCGSPLTLETWDGSERIEVSSVEACPGADAAIVWAPAVMVSFIPLRREAVRLGEPVHSAGWAAGHRLILTSGRIGSPLGTSSAPLIYGLSGGPTVDSNGRAVGINSAIEVLRSRNLPLFNVAIFVPLSEIWPWLVQRGIVSK